MESVREWELQFKGMASRSNFNQPLVWTHDIQVKINDFLLFPLEKKKKLEKYEYVGRLLRPGEEPNSYSDEEEESSESAATKAHKSEDNIKNLNSSATTATVTDKPKDE